MILADSPTDNDDSPPRVSHELITHLDKIYPMRAFKKAVSVEDLRMLQGAHEVIDLQRNLYLRQIGESHVLLETPDSA